MAGLTSAADFEFDDLGGLSTSPGLPGGGGPLDEDVSVLFWPRSAMMSMIFRDFSKKFLPVNKTACDGGRQRYQTPQKSFS